MKAINLITLLLVIVGGINWGLVGLAQFDLVAALFGGQSAALSRIVYVLVGVSALWQLVPFSKAAISLAEAEDGAEKLKLTKGQAVYNAELEIRDLAKKLDKARASISTMEMSVALAEKAYRLSEQGYRAGTIEYLDLKDAETSLLQARLGVVMEKYNYLSTLLDLETAVNARLD